jgi:hypothetical protein
VSAPPTEARPEALPAEDIRNELRTGSPLNYLWQAGGTTTDPKELEELARRDQPQEGTRVDRGKHESRQNSVKLHSS